GKLAWVSLVRFLPLIGLAAAAAFGVAWWRAGHAAALVESALVAETAHLPVIIAELRGYRRWADPRLRDAYAEAERAGAGANSDAERERQAHRQLHASLALLPADPGQVEYLYGRLLEAGPQEAAVIVEQLSDHQGQLIERLWGVVEQPG